MREEELRYIEKKRRREERRKLRREKRKYPNYAAHLWVVATTVSSLQGVFECAYYCQISQCLCYTKQLLLLIHFRVEIFILFIQ